MTSADDPATKEDIKRLVDMWRMQDPRHMGLIDKRDLAHLVRVALEHGEISTSKAGELLGLSVEEVRALTRVWARDDDDVSSLTMLRCDVCGVVTEHKIWRASAPALHRAECLDCKARQDV